jgi:hypothetical protein
VLAILFPLICVVLLLNLILVVWLLLRYSFFCREERRQLCVAPAPPQAKRQGGAKVIPIRGARVC